MRRLLTETELLLQRIDSQTTPGDTDSDHQADSNELNPTEALSGELFQHTTTALPDIVSDDLGTMREHPTPSKVVTELDKKEVSETGCQCCICQDHLVVGEVASCLPCGHEFHSDCIATWLKVQQTCPVCRTNIIPESDVPESAQPPAALDEATAAIVEGVRAILGFNELSASDQQEYSPMRQLTQQLACQLEQDLMAGREQGEGRGEVEWD